MAIFNSYVSLPEGNLCGVFGVYLWILAMSGIGFPIDWDDLGKLTCAVW